MKPENVPTELVETALRAALPVGAFDLEHSLATQEYRDALAAVLGPIYDELEKILTVIADGAEVDDRSSETYLQIAQKRGGALEQAGDMLIDLQDRISTENH